MSLIMRKEYDREKGGQSIMDDVRRVYPSLSAIIAKENLAMP